MEFDEVPDCFDLRGWIMDNMPEWFEATKYLSPSVQYQADLRQWEAAGKPAIEGELAVDYNTPPNAQNAP